MLSRKDKTLPATSGIKRRGFTLVEMVAVLVLLGVLVSVALPKYVDLSSNARDRAIHAGIAELNGREALAWGNLVISNAGFTDDATTFAVLDTSLGSDYAWTVAPAAIGGTVAFQGGAGVALARSESTSSSPGSWDLEGNGGNGGNGG